MNTEPLPTSIDETAAAQIAGDIIVAAAEHSDTASVAERVEKAQLVANRTRPNLRKVLDEIEESAIEQKLSPEEIRTAKRDAVMLSRRR